MGAVESTLQFQHNVSLLFGESSSPETGSSADIDWTMFYRASPSTGKSFLTEEIFTSFTPTKIRKLLRESPALAQSLIVTLVDRLERSVNERSAKEGIISGGTDVSLPAWEDSDSQETIQSIRILTRLLPYVFEYEFRDFERKIFWTEKGSESVEGESNAEPASSEANLAVKLVKSVIDLLFMPNFVFLPGDNGVGNDNVVDSVKKKLITCLDIEIWESGIVVPIGTLEKASTSDMKRNRFECIRLILVLMSRLMYISTNKIYKLENSWATLLVSCSSRNRVLSIFTSLLNTFLKYDGTWSLYGSESEIYAFTSLQLIISLTDYSFPLSMSDKRLFRYKDRGWIDFDDPTHPTKAAFREPREMVEKSTQIEDESDSMGVENLYCNALASLQRPEDFSYIIDRVIDYLVNMAKAKGSFIQGTRKVIDFEQDIVIFLWKMLELSKPFYDYFVQDARALKVIDYILYYCELYKGDMSSNGFLHICSFILILVSGERSFCVSLNDPVQNLSLLGSLGSKSPFYPLSCIESYADALILMVLDLISVNKSTLTECLLTVLVNSSPFIKKINVSVAHRLVSQVNKLFHPSILYYSEDSFRMLCMVLDVVGNLILYQGDGNSALVYVCLRERKIFTEIAEATYSFLSERRQTYLDKMNSHYNKDKSLLTISSAWFEAFQSSLHLDPVILIIDGLSAKIDDYCEKNEIVEELDVIAYLGKLTLVGLVPSAPPISIRKYKSNVGIKAWLTSYYYGNLYLKFNDPPIWLGTEVKLFQVKSSSSGTSSITESK